jgi:hypothetical protein
MNCLFSRVLSIAQIAPAGFLLPCDFAPASSFEVFPMSCSPSLLVRRLRRRAFWISLNQRDELLNARPDRDSQGLATLRPPHQELLRWKTVDG